MKKNNSVQFFLMVSGIIGIVIGAALLFIPKPFEASAGINLGDNNSLLSEIRASGGMLFCTGILIFLGTFRPKLTNISLLLSTLFYLSYGLSRILSIIIDGMPDKTLVIATVFEIIIGIISFILFHKSNKEID
ncbi:conserved membrane hypothetical protein [Flavobacterium sp. 9AF]|uniref:DUF4345 domain-containing protein n=1 Tax=Flavobacterium sp. 9AF TaxID=2653142 RepID=UPI0012F32777|nr:DUF4345 domain-containing protein [Flavobacterium sp. 9AF]VXC07470.1 conserved membrane hypothetical protein [Flavobacterium sp. 9AF]